MRKVSAFVSVALLAAGPAFAADLAVKAPMYKAPVVVPAFSWTGCYIGAEAGGVWGRSRHTETGTGLPITTDFSVNGGLAGGTVGCNYQFGTWVLGVENDISWTNASGSQGDNLPFFNPAFTSHTSEKWIDTLRGRVGYAWDRTLFYGTGGAAFAGTEVASTTAGLDATASRTVTGWVAGAGIEYAPAAWGNHVTLKLEYLHADFGSTSYVPNSPLTVPRDVTLTNDIVRAGVNYKF